MIEVKYTYNENTRQVSLSVKGHAGHAPKGADIICAGASLLTFTAAHLVEIFAHHGDLEGEPVISLKDGDAQISCTVKDTYLLGELLTMLFAVTRGYELLAHSYPENISFN